MEHEETQRIARRLHYTALDLVSGWDSASPAQPHQDIVTAAAMFAVADRLRAMR